MIKRNQKKIGIITTHHYPNYGNKLQNYALQTVLQRMGFLVETINDARSWKSANSWLANWKVLLHYIFRYRLNSYHIKQLKFIKWSKKHIIYSSCTINKTEDVNLLCDKYDYFVVGSDQIWNPEWPIFSNSFGFAEFARKEQKIAYAPSLGVSEMIPERVEEYRHWLSNWKALSCREYEGAKIIEELSGEGCTVVVDPTLLLSPKDWELMIATRSKFSKKYALLYHLRNIDDETYKKILLNVKEKGLDLYVVKSHEQNDIFGPGEFLKLIKDAEIVYTDSFHGSVFAMQFHKSLCILNLQDSGKNKMSRLKTLFEHVCIEHNTFPSVLNYFTDINWKIIDENLEIKRKESMTYLMENLN